MVVAIVTLAAPISCTPLMLHLSDPRHLRHNNMPSTDEVKESAALVLANCTQHDDKVCVELASMPTDDLKAFLAHLKCEYARTG